MKIESKKIKNLILRNYPLLIILLMIGYLGYTLWVGYKNTHGIFAEETNISVPETNSEFLFDEKQYENLRSALEVQSSEIPLPRNPFQAPVENSNNPIPR